MWLACLVRPKDISAALCADLTQAKRNWRRGLGNRVDVLWTGGWDSTFRVLFLSMVEEREVRPHYVLDFGRKSSVRELMAISDVRREIEKIDENAARQIKELIVTPVTEISPIEEVSLAHGRLKNRAKLGDQYDWLSRYARQRNIENLELSVHVDDKAYNFLQGKVEQRDEGGWSLRDDAKGDIEIFSCFSFPLLEMSKIRMREEAKKLGFIHALEKSWFCHTPHKGAPCGTCGPCIFTIEEGMEYRLPASALRAYKTRHIRNALKFPVRASRKVYRRFRG